ncbi:hypothetical protein ACFZCL_32450 [Streptomyces sp. NPDC008159]|uniref:hypothetical protein n=1 Tax=Streptomyces sp. NPDC008159 TaxID=3364817 RepID=UPI0036E507AA
MTAMISVKVEGPVGLDEPQELLEELGRETGLDWRLETVGQKGTLGGDLAFTLLEALLEGAVGAAVGVAAQRAVDTWRGRRLDPPTVTIVFQMPQTPGVPPAPGAPTAPGAPGTAGTPGTAGAPGAPGTSEPPQVSEPPHAPGDDAGGPVGPGTPEGS